MCINDSLTVLKTTHLCVCYFGLCSPAPQFVQFARVERLLFCQLLKNGGYHSPLRFRTRNSNSASVSNTPSAVPSMVTNKTSPPIRPVNVLVVMTFPLADIVPVR